MRDTAGISRQNLLSHRVIGMRQYEVPVLVTTKEPIIVANNQPDMDDSTGVIQTPHAVNTPTMQELIADMNPYIKMNVDRNPWIISRTGIDGVNPAVSISGTSAFDSCPSTTPPSICRWNGIIGNTGKTVTRTNPSFRYTSELHTSIDGIFPNDSNVLSVVSKILCGEFYASSGRNLNS